MRSLVRTTLAVTCLAVVATLGSCTERGHGSEPTTSPPHVGSRVKLIALDASIDAAMARAGTVHLAVREPGGTTQVDAQLDPLVYEARLTSLSGRHVTVRYLAGQIYLWSTTGSGPARWSAATVQDGDGLGSTVGTTVSQMANLLDPTLTLVEARQETLDVTAVSGTTVSYAVTLSEQQMRAVAARQGADVRADDPVVPLTIRMVIAGSGLPVRLETTGPTTATVEYSAWGDPAHVTAPPTAGEA